jgi:hypothetical protein
MSKRVVSIVPAAIAALVLCGIVTAATAASDHPKRKIAHATKPAQKPPAAPAVPDRQRPTM